MTPNPFHFILHCGIDGQEKFLSPFLERPRAFIRGRPFSSRSVDNGVIDFRRIFSRKSIQSPVETILDDLVALLTPSRSSRAVLAYHDSAICNSEDGAQKRASTRTAAMIDQGISSLPDGICSLQNSAKPSRFHNKSPRYTSPKRRRRSTLTPLRLTVAQEGGSSG